MAREPHVRLTDEGIARLPPREKEYTVWDSRVAGLGVRVRPSGGKSYVLLRKTGNVLRRISLGPAMLKSVVEVRREFEKPEAKEKPVRQVRPRRAVPDLRDFVAGPWTEAHFNRYKPSTQKGVRFQLDRRILPAFGSKRLDRISPAAVRRWFDRCSRTAPGSANEGLGILRQIMNFAVACGHVESNPTNGIRLNRGNKLSRFLSREEIARLHAVLDRHALKVARRQQVDIIRLLLLTGCRKGEIVNLRWSEVDGDTLVLEDSKTGPRRVPLNTPARRVLERQPRSNSDFVFPSPRDPAGPRTGDLGLWYRVRREAGIEDCRLHDLRHTLASQAVMNGVPVPVVSRLLGHSRVSMTLRYAHLGDRDVEEAAERVGRYIGSKLGLGFGGRPEGVDAAPAAVSIDAPDRVGERSGSGRHRDDVMIEATGISRSVVRRTADMDWQPSPVAGVWRKRLELAGAVEAGRVTSVVRFDPGARFPRHAHPDGEEILVLDGVFSDETGDYPAGSHLLNPDGTSHAPWSGPGCTLFVKLRQYPGADRPRLAIDTASAVWQAGPVEGSELLALYRDPAPGEGHAGLARMAPGCVWDRDPRPGGEEVFVVEGVLEDGHGRHGVGSWLRHWPGGAHRWHSPEGCLLYVKQGHLGRYDEGWQRTPT